MIEGGKPDKFDIRSGLVYYAKGVADKKAIDLKKEQIFRRN